MRLPRAAAGPGTSRGLWGQLPGTSSPLTFPIREMGVHPSWSRSQLQSRALSNINSTTVMRGAWPQDGRRLGRRLRERCSPSEGSSRRWAPAGRGPAGTRAWLGHGVRFRQRGQRSQAIRDIWYLTCDSQPPFSCVPSTHSSPAPPASSPNSGPSCQGPGPPRGSVGMPRLVETLTQPRERLED